MTRVALRGLAARPLRTALTTLAIVIGVAFVAAAYTLTDTLRGAADSLSSAAYDGTDAVVTGRTAFKLGSEDSSQRPTVPASLLATVRHAPGVSVAAGDVSDQAMILGRDGRTVGSGPYFGAGLDARTPGALRTLSSVAAGITGVSANESRPGSNAVLEVTTASVPS